MEQSLKETLISSLIKLMEEHSEIHLLDVDVGVVYGSKILYKKYPERCHQIGIAEQNAIGIAAGLAAAGKIPIIISLACFITGRCYDQIRLNLSLSKFPVLIVGLHSGSFLGPDGPTHQANDDVGLINALPNIKLRTPSTHKELNYSLRLGVKEKSPTYIRLFFPPIKNNLSPLLKIGERVDHLVLSHGYPYSLIINSLLNSQYKKAIIVRSICFQEENHLLNLIKRYESAGIKKISIIEDNFYTGSTASILLALLNKNKFNIEINYKVVPNQSGICGTVDDVKNFLGLTSKGVLDFLNS